MAQVEARKNNSFMQNVNLKLTFQYVISGRMGKMASPIAIYRLGRLIITQFPWKKPI
jgi:hypothetical protein